jgi:hypothetical protein
VNNNSAIQIFFTPPRIPITGLSFTINESQLSRLLDQDYFPRTIEFFSVNQLSGGLMRFISLFAFIFLTPTMGLAEEVDFLGPIVGSAHHIEMDQIDPGPEFDLIGGQLATSDNFPGIFQSRSASSRCTATLVASRVVATAAHCVATGSLLTLNYRSQAYTGLCARAVQFYTNPTADWALCLLDRPIPDQIAESIDWEGGGTI